MRLKSDKRARGSASPVLLALLSLTTSLFLSFLLSSCGEPEEPVPFKHLEWEDSLFQFGGKPFTGTAIDYFKNGKTKKSEIGFRNGLYHGVAREWWSNGTVQTETTFKEGKRHGKNTYWDEDGKLIKEQVYDMDTVVEEKVYQ